MNIRQRHFDWGFGVQWLLAVAVGAAAAALLAFAFMWDVGEVLEKAWGETIAIPVTGGVFGAILALGSNLGPGWLLRRDGVSAGRWIIVSTVAGALGMAVAFTLVFAFFDPDGMSDLVVGNVMGLALGLPIGLGQTHILRQHQLATDKWLVIIVHAYLIAMTAGITLGEGLGITLMGVLLGAVSALGIVWLRQKQAAVVA